jgi:hypothetical protein
MKKLLIILLFILLLAIPVTATTYSGIHMVNATGSGPASGTMIGNVTNVTNDTQAWFTIGTSSNSYTYSTKKLSPDSVTKNFSLTLTGIPLMPGTLYYVRAVSTNGMSAEELYFVTGYLSTSPVTQTNYGDYYKMVKNNLTNPQNAMSAVSLPPVDAFGGGNMGWAIFFTLLFGVALIILWIRQENLLLTVMVLVLGSSVILYMIQADLVWIVFAVVSIVFGAAMYRIVRGTQT